VFDVSEVTLVNYTVSHSCL